MLVVILVSAQLASGGNQKKLQIELSGNYHFVQPEHLNSLAASEMQYLTFCFDKIYDSKSENGRIKSTRSLQTITTRLKYSISSSIQLSAGLSYLWNRVTSPYEVTYYRQESWRSVTDELDYLPWNTNIYGFIPSVGIHLNVPVSRTMQIEFSMTGGPLFVTLEYQKEMNQSLISVSEQSLPVYNSKRSLQMDGKGTGVSLLGSIKLMKALTGAIGLSLEGGYAWQRVHHIEGSGTATFDDHSTIFTGEWGLVTELITTDWGSKELKFPTNDWQEFGQKSDDFILDLSGFYIAIGFYLSL